MRTGAPASWSFAVRTGRPMRASLQQDERGAAAAATATATATAGCYHQGVMPKLIETPTRIAAAGNKPKIIEEYAGRVNTGTDAVSVARMRSPEGWVEPGQRPLFDETTLVLKGMLRVEFEGGVLDVREGQAVIANKGEWVRYSSPLPGGAEYVAVCVPAFSPDTVRRDAPA
jgi:mannose-6-phosphate isomerase-like protein (cupin superfamily)